MHFGVRRADVGDGREQHGVEAQLVHPVFEIDAPGLFEAAQAVGHGADFIPRRDAALGHAHVFVHAGSQAAGPVFGKGAGRHRNDRHVAPARQLADGRRRTQAEMDQLNRNLMNLLTTS